MGELYKRAGVDGQKADELVGRIGIGVGSRNGGRFGDVCEHKYLTDYYVVTTTDGIGSKITPLMENKMYSTVANDLIAANLNNLVCSGAAPISFSDYISVNKLEPEPVSEVILELKKRLKLYGCELFGGETSELKNIIQEEKIDMAGFTVGLVKKENLIDIENVFRGDYIVGLCSSGPHSNGFSLIDYFYRHGQLTDEEFKLCLEPTVVYMNEILQLTENRIIKSAANIAGGGIMNNLKRALPKYMKADIDYSEIPPQEIFRKLYSLCGDEALEVFNMGVGFCVIVSKRYLEPVMQHLEKYNPFILGRVL